jgi:hypothetical protein
MRVGWCGCAAACVGARARAARCGRCAWAVRAVAGGGHGGGEEGRARVCARDRGCARRARGRGADGPPAHATMQRSGKQVSRHTHTPQHTYAACAQHACARARRRSRVVWNERARAQAGPTCAATSSPLPLAPSLSSCLGCGRARRRLRQLHAAALQGGGGAGRRLARPAGARACRRPGRAKAPPRSPPRALATASSRLRRCSSTLNAAPAPSTCGPPRRSGACAGARACAQRAALRVNVRAGFDIRRGGCYGRRAALVRCCRADARAPARLRVPAARRRLLPWRSLPSTTPPPASAPQKGARALRSPRFAQKRTHTRPTQNIGAFARGARRGAAGVHSSTRSAQCPV